MPTFPPTVSFPATATFPGILELTNAQKLALPANTPIGTRVQVTDAISVSGGTQDGLYTQRGSHNGRSWYALAGVNADVTNNGEQIYWDSAGGKWYFYDADGNETYYSDSDVETPDLAEWENESHEPANLTLSHHVTQQLAIAGPSDETHWTTL